MATGAGGRTQPNTRILGQAFRRGVGLACAAIVIAASQPGYGTEIYRWIDAEGRVHFSDVPPSRVDNAPLRALKPAPRPAKVADVPEGHYSVLNQAKRFETDRLAREEVRAGSVREPKRGNRRGRRSGSGSGGGYVDDLDQLGYGVYSTLGPRTDLTKFPPPGHPVYSPTLGYPPNEYYHMGRYRPNTRLGGLPPARHHRRGGFFGRR